MSIPLSKDVLNLLINLGGITKKLPCEKCNSFKDHVSVTNAALNDDAILKILGRANDLNPLYTLTAGVPFVCISCGKGVMDGGLFSDALNQTSYREVFVNNKTDLDMLVYVHFYGEDEEWHTVKFKFSPRENAKVLSKHGERRTTNKYVYFYAISSDGDRVVEGSDLYISIAEEQCGFIKKDMGENMNFTWSFRG